MLPSPVEDATTHNRSERMSQRRYSFEFKVAAVRSLTESDRPVAEVARELGVSRSTLRRWREVLADLTAEDDPKRLDGGDSARERRSTPSEESGIASGVTGDESGGPPSDHREGRGQVGLPEPRHRHGAPYPRSDEPPRPGPVGIDLFQLIPVLKRHAKLIAVTTVLGIAAAALWIMLEVPRYRATAVIRVGETREVLTQGFETPVRDGAGHVNPFLSAIQLLKSRSLLGEVIDSAGLRLDPDYRGFRADLLHSTRVESSSEADSLWLEFDDGGLSVRTQQQEERARYGQRVEIGGVSFVVSGRPSSDRATWTITPREQAIDQLLEELRITPRDQTNVVDISYLHPSPQTSRQVVNTLVRSYQTLEARFAQERASRRRAFLEEQVAETETRLAEAQDALSAFQTGAQSYGAGEELAAQQQNRMLLDIRVSELDAERRMLQTLLDRLDVAPTDDERWEVLRTLVSSPGIAENIVVSQMHERLLRHRTVLDSLTLGGFGAAAGSPEVQRLEELISAAEQELTRAIRSHVASLDGRAAALDELATRTAAALATIPPQLAREERLAQVISTYQNLADQLREEYQKARMSEAVAVGHTDIIDLATLPYEPAPSLLVVKLGLGFFLGLTFGGVGALTVEYRRRSVSSKVELEEMFRLPVLGVIPESSDPTTNRLVPANTSEADEAREQIDSGPASRAVYAREAYRMLCTNLFFAGWTREARTISITSTVPQEGKTLTAANLAVSMAGEGMEVLLVDADIWRGRIHDIFDVPATPGLGEVLRGEVSAADAVCESGLHGLWLLPRGDSGRSPSLLTRQSPLKTVLDGLSQDFDVVLVDGPPVLASGSAPALAAVTDGVLLLVQAGRTDRDLVEEALQELNTVGARVLGAILNDPGNVTAADRRRYRYYEYANP